jgi:hypothetical protein
MDVLLPGRAPDLARWEGRPFADGVAEPPRPTDRQDHYERVVGREPAGPPIAGGPFRNVADAILRYTIFPPALVTGALRRAPVAVGDTVGIRFHGYRVVDLFFAARVIEVFDGPAPVEPTTSGDGPAPVEPTTSGDGPAPVEPTTSGTPGGWHTGFTYRTLRGHPELGQETFAVAKAPDGTVSVSLRSWSRAGTVPARIFAPLVRLSQVGASHAALVHLAAVADGRG